MIGRVEADMVGTTHGDLYAVAPGQQVCIACHAPHRAPSSPLLWNHRLSSNNFSWSDWTKTTGGTSLPTNIKTWSGSSKACLSCHDGSVAIGAIYEPNVNFFNYTMTGSAARHQIGGLGELKGNHPVAIPYPYGGVKNTYNGITTGDEALQSGWVATPTKVKIYADENTAGPSNRGIECGSCHDPHGTSNSDYLRDTITGSSLCRNCHAK